MDRDFLFWKRNITWGGCLLILLTGLLFYRLALKEKVDEWLLSSRELAVQKRIADIRRKNHEEYDDNLRVLEETEANIVLLEDQVMAYHRIPLCISRVNAWLAECELVVSLFAIGGYEELPDIVWTNGRVLKVRAVLEGEGRYEDILFFLDKMNMDPTYYSVDRFTLTESESDGMRFGVDFSFYAYKQEEG